MANLYIFTVDYKGGTFEKRVYADTFEAAQTAIAARYEGSPDFTVLEGKAA
jgi:hypothetical protein